MCRICHFPAALPILLMAMILLSSSEQQAMARPPLQTTRIKILTANLSDNTTQAYKAPGIRLIQSLNPDIVAIQEFNYKEGNSQDLVHRIFGPEYHFIRERGGARLPNGVISRYPIEAWGQWPDPFVKNRSFVWATIDIPGPVPLHVISVHLVQNRASRRPAEAAHLLELIREHFPEKDYVVLCGDMNVNSRNAKALSNLTEWFVDDRHPADQKGDQSTNATRKRPYDMVLPNPILAPFHAATIVNRKRFPNGLVYDTRLWNPPPAPAEWEDTARNLQHLPVMKTYRIPLR